MDSVIYVLNDRPDKYTIVRELEELGWKAHGLVELIDSTKKHIKVLVMLRESK